MLEGLLVDLVPFNKIFRDLEHTWRNSEATFWASGGDRPIMSKARIDAQFQEWVQGKEHNSAAGIPFGVQTKSGKPIGSFGINWIVPHCRLAMLGAKIGEPEYWGGGYGTDALLLIVDYAFEWLDMRKIWLATTSKNARVQRQMEKVGFTLEARFREQTLMDGEWHDGLIYGLLREEWPGRPALIDKLGLRAREEVTG